VAQTVAFLSPHLQPEVSGHIFCAGNPIGFGSEFNRNWISFCNFCNTNYLCFDSILPVKRFLAFFLTALMLLQTLGQEVLVVNYQLNKARITELYCINKARPQLKCNGKCHLAKQLRKTNGSDKKAPVEGMAKVKYEVLPTAALVLAVPQHWPLPARHFPALWVAGCATGTGLGVFHPPLLLT
jgi:hypothetical protein